MYKVIITKAFDQLKPMRVIYVQVLRRIKVLQYKYVCLHVSLFLFHVLTTEYNVLMWFGKENGCTSSRFHDSVQILCIQFNLLVAL